MGLGVVWFSALLVAFALGRAEIHCQSSGADIAGSVEELRR